MFHNYKFLSKKDGRSKSWFIPRVHASLMLFACFLFSSVYAQIPSQYVFSTGTGASLITQTSPTTIIGTGIDDTPSPLTNIGFTFNFAGASYTQYTVTPDGFMKLGSPVGVAQFTNDIATTTTAANLTNQPKLFPYWEDMATGAAAGGGYVRASVEGTAPNRILVVEWFVTVPRVVAGNANTRFQAQLYETTNEVRFVYGTATANPTAQTASVGISALVSSVINFQSVTVSNHTVSTTVANNSIATFPASGRFYSFIAPTGDVTPPVITDIVYTPFGGQCTATSRTVSATITDDSGVDSAFIEYTVDGVPQTRIAMTDMGGDMWEGVIPPHSNGIVSFAIRAFDSGNNSLNAPMNILSGRTVYQDEYLPLLNLSATPSTVNQGDPSQLTALTAFQSPIRITEFTLFRTGTGATNPYPATVGAGDDLLEISNLSSAPVSTQGIVLEFYTGTTLNRSYNMPNAVIPANGVMVLHIGTGTDNPTNLFFNTGGTSNVLSSGGAAGYILRSGSTVIDAIAINTFTFPALANVGSAWSGAGISSPSGRAGASLVGADANNNTNWVASNTPTPLQTFGTYNTGLSPLSGPTITWSGPNSFNATGASVSTGALNTIGANVFSASITDGTCTRTSTVTITVVNPNPPVADFSASTTNLTWNGVAPAPVTFTDLSTNIPTGWSWSFSPSTVTYVNSTTASSQNPQVRFDAPGAYTVTLVASNGQGSDTETKTAFINVVCGSYITIAANAMPSIVNQGDNSTLAVTSNLNPGVRITELVLFRTGTGATPAYPAFATGADLIEITNTNSAPVNVSGFQIEITGTGARSFILPANTIIPGGGIAIIHIGPGTDDPGNRYYNMGGTSDLISSGTAFGVIIRNGSIIVDAVAVNAHVFPVGSGVTAAHWSGTGVPSPSGAAGTRLLGADNNNNSNWVGSDVSTMNVGTINPGIVVSGSPVYTWTGGNLVGSAFGDTIISPAFASTGTFTFTVSVTDGFCTASTTVDVDVLTPQVPVAEFSASATNLTWNGVAPTPVTFTDLSTNLPTGWSWSFSPSTVTFVNSTTASSQNPQVRFDAPGAYTVTLVASNGQGSDTETKTAFINVVCGSYLSVQAGALATSINQGGAATLTASSGSSQGLKVTEVVLFRTGTGATPTYPAFATGQDLIELTNTSTGPINIGGFQIEITGDGARTYTLPTNVIIPGSGIAIIHIGSGTDDPANRYYNMGGASDAIFSGGNLGVIIRNGSLVVDAVAINAHTFPPAANITAAQWSGAGASSPSGAAGTRLTGADNNNNSNWQPSTTSTMNVGTLNTGLVVAPPPVFTWTGGNLAGPTNGDTVVTPVFATTGQFTFTVSITDGFCSASNNIIIDVVAPTPPVAEFSANNLTPFVGATPSTVTFTDLSTNVPASWNWVITPASFNFVNSTSASSPNPQVVFTAATTYTVSLTVTNPAGSSTETKTNYITSQLSYCVSSATSAADEEIFNVSIGSLNNSSTCTTLAPGLGSVQNMYSNYTTLPATQLERTVSYPLSVEIGTCGGNFINRTAAFIDWNQDGVFDAVTERVLDGAAVSGPNTQIGTVIVPANAVLGITRMRVVNIEQSAQVQPCGTYSWGETEDYLIEVLPAPTCTDPPNAGTISGAPASLCAGSGFTATVSGFTLGTTTQWQSSTDGINFTDIVGATTSVLVVSNQTVATHYRFRVICTDTAYTASSFVGLSPFFNCYCVSRATSAADEEIFNVSIGTLNNSSTCATTAPGPGSIQNMYSNYTTLPATELQRTVVYPLSVQVGTCGGNFINRTAVYIDWNRDGVYDPTTERVLNGAAVSGPNTQTANVTVPASAALGVTGMRVVNIEQSGVVPPCGTYSWGETEDYLVEITPAPIVNNIDLQMVDISLNSDCGLTANESISLIAVNNGNPVLAGTQVDFSFRQFGSAATINQTITLSADWNSFDSLIVQVPGTFDFSNQRKYSMRAVVTIAGDQNTANNELRKPILNRQVVTVYPYRESFEGSNSGWEAGGDPSSWQVGIPAGTVINSAADGSRAWVTNLTGQYLPSERSFVTGPCFDFSSFTTRPFLTMSIFRNAENNWDGAQVQYSINNGQTWVNTGGVSTDWYNSSTMTSADVSAFFNGNTNWFTGTAITGWRQVEVQLPTAVVGQSKVLIRVAFASDPSVQNEGIAFDNVIISSTSNIGTPTLISSLDGCGRSDFAIGGPAGVNNQMRVAPTGNANHRFFYQISNAAGTVQLGVIQTNGVNTRVEFGNYPSIFQAGNTYTVRVVLGNQFTQPNFVGVASCQIGFAPLPAPAAVGVTQIFGAACGSQNYTLSPAALTNTTGVEGVNHFNAVRLPNATAYDFEISDVNNNVLGVISTNWLGRVFVSNHTAIFAYGNTYNVRVRAYIGTVAGDYGATCVIGFIQDPNVVTPAPTQLRFCNMQNVSAATRLERQNVGGASSYTFFFYTDAAATNLYATAFIPASRQLSAGDVVPGLLPLTTYYVVVRADVGGVITAPGAICEITTAGLVPRYGNIDLNAETVFGLNAYPNPFIGNTQIIVSSSDDAPALLNVYDIAGKLIITKQVAVNQTIEIGAGLAAGHYVLEAVRGNGEKATFRIAKTN